MAGLTIMHQHHATLPTVRLAVTSGGSGSPLLLLHAFPLDHSMWEAQNTLTDRLHLIVPDQRGFGGSNVGCGNGRSGCRDGDDDNINIDDGDDNNNGGDSNGNDEISVIFRKVW